MPLPTAEATTGRQAKDRNFYDLDSLIGELNQPKEVIQSAVQTQNFASQNPPLGGQEVIEEPTEQISPEVAALSGKTIAGTIDTVLATGMSLYAKQTNSVKYEAAEKQLSQLENAWAAVALKYGYKVEDSPWLNVALLNVAVYLPKFQEAKKDRRFAEMEEKIREEQAAREALAKRVDNLENKS